MGVVGEVQSAGALERCGEWVASRRAGQLLFRGVDSVLRLIEKSLMWSTQTQSPQRPAVAASSSPGAGDASKETSFVVMSRPLSWPLFLPLLGVLGVARITVYYVTRVFRKPRDTTDMIHWLQIQRRRLRAVKNAGLRNIRLTHPKSDCISNGTPSGKRDHQSTPDHERKRKYDDVEQSDWTDGSDDESVAVKLEKCAKDYDSESDPDFVPSSDEGSSEDEGSAASGDEDVEDEEGAVLVNGADIPVADAVSVSSPKTPAAVLSPSIVTVESPESVSDHAKADAESTTSTGSSVTAPPLSPRSKLVKFFRRGSKNKQQL